MQLQTLGSYLKLLKYAPSFLLVLFISISELHSRFGSLSFLVTYFSSAKLNLWQKLLLL